MARLIAIRCLDSPRRRKQSPLKMGMAFFRTFSVKKTVPFVLLQPMKCWCDLRAADFRNL
ncbi:hypothetical protein MANES_14G062166v8 [Manihot esculenta]|uniref:Uncharacterized protein n=1 Tax=Manihot esculenta TaxID=3983 RepID=A0ACB7GG59_MANES|nr:hypothetical protein MANES_14G062166v8 [Manihot esculenta]